MTGNELANKVLVDQSAMGCANSLMENLDLVIKALRAYDKALVPEALTFEQIAKICEQRAVQIERREVEGAVICPYTAMRDLAGEFRARVSPLLEKNP